MINHGVVEDSGSGEVTPLMIMRMMTQLNDVDGDHSGGEGLEND